MNYSEKVIQNNFNAIYSYSSLKDFYENGVGDSQYEYNIITPRKAMGLNKIFFDPCENMTQNCIQATTKSFVLYIEEICKKIENGDAKEHSFISIVDDILLYGRTINEFLKKLIDIIAKRTGKTEKDIGRFIDINVFARSDKECQIERDRYNSLNTKIWFKYDECMKLSDIIMKTFYELPVSNTTTIINYYYQKEGKTLEEHLTKQAEQNVKWEYIDLNEIESESILRKKIKKTGLKSIIFYKKDQHNFFQIIRCYINKNSNKAIIIPYVFLDQIEQNQLNSIWEKKGLDFLNDSDDEIIQRGYGVLQYEILINLISINTMNEFLNDFTLSLDDFKIDKNVMNISFGRKISNYLENYVLGKESKKDFSDLKYYPNGYEGDLHLKEVYNEVLSESEGKKTYEILEGYFEQNGKIDDDLAKKKKGKRTEGLSVKYMEQKYSEKNQGHKKDFYFALISTMDQGISALSVQDHFVQSIQENKIVYGQIIQSGEQAYRIGIEELAPLICFKKSLERKYQNRLFDIQQREKALEIYEEQVIEDFLKNTENENEKERILELYRKMQHRTNNMNLIRTDEELRESILFESAEKIYKKYTKIIDKYVLG